MQMQITHINESPAGEKKIIYLHGANEIYLFSLQQFLTVIHAMQCSLDVT